VLRTCTRAGEKLRRKVFSHKFSIISFSVYRSEYESVTASSFP
jgi:hypothetical protein